MKRFHRRCRRLCILAALLVLLVLFLRQNVLLDTASRHAILLDAQSGRVLAQKRADERTAPASLTKMMTVLLAIETEPDLDKQVTLPEDIFPALQTEKASMAGFVPDETVTVRDLLYGAMLPSGAECCEALAQLVSGSEENFAALMNQKAAELGMKNTHFTNPHGLNDTNHYTRPIPSTIPARQIWQSSCRQHYTMRPFAPFLLRSTTPPQRLRSTRRAFR